MRAASAAGELQLLLLLLLLLGGAVATEGGHDGVVAGGTSHADALAQLQRLLAAERRRNGQLEDALELANRRLD